MCHLSEKDETILVSALIGYTTQLYAFTGYDIWVQCCQVAKLEKTIFPVSISDTSAKVRELFNAGTMVFANYGATKTHQEDNGSAPLLYFPIPKEIQKRCKTILASVGEEGYTPPKKPRYAKTKTT